jgi:MFS family permease
MRRGPLRVPGFANLAASYAINELGNWFGEVALAVLVYDATGSTLATAGLFLAMQVVPSLLGPGLVARLERVATRRVLPALYAGETAAFVALALLAHNFSLAAVLAIAFADGLLAATARALTRASAASLLRPKRLLREGNAILNIAFTVAAAAGPALAGALVAAGGTQSALFLDAGSFAVAGLSILAARGLPEASPDDGHWWSRLRGGITYVRAHPTIRLLLGGQAAVLVFYTAVIPVEVALAKVSLDAGDLGYGALLAGWGVGTIFGGAIFARYDDHSLRSLAGWSTAAMGVSYLLTGASPTIALAVAGTLIGGTGNGIQFVAVLTALQEMATPDQQARIISFNDLVWRVVPGVGYLLGGAIAALASPRLTYFVAGVGGLVVLGMFGPRLLKRSWAPALDEQGEVAERRASGNTVAPAAAKPQAGAT